MSVFLCNTGGVCTGAGIGEHWWVWRALSSPPALQPPAGKRHQASDIHQSRALSPHSAWTRQIQRVFIKANWFFPLESHPFRGKMCLGKAEEPKFLTKIHSQPSCGTSSSKRRERQSRKGTGSHMGQSDLGFGTNRLWRVCTAFPFVAVAIKISPGPWLALHVTLTASVQIVGLSQSLPSTQTYAFYTTLQIYPQQKGVHDLENRFSTQSSPLFSWDSSSLRYKPWRPGALRWGAGTCVGRRLPEAREEGRSPLIPQDFSAGVCSQEQQNNSEGETKIGEKGTSKSGLLLKMVQLNQGVGESCC